MVFEIVLREIIAAVHRIYLDLDSEMNRLLQTLVSPDAIDLRLAYYGSPEATQELVYLLENICFQMTYIQPHQPLLKHLRRLFNDQSKDLSIVLARDVDPNDVRDDVSITSDKIEDSTQAIEDFLLNICFHVSNDIPESGVLGTHRRSHLFALIKDGQLFPPDEFWEIEKRLLRFDFNGRTTNIGTREAMLLITLMFFARGLIWTLLLHPVDYGLTPVEPDPVSRENCKLMASLLMLIYRRVIVPRDARVIPPAPAEIAQYLVRDDVLEPLVERIENTMLYCDGLIREWANAYVRRLKQALPPRV